MALNSEDPARLGQAAGSEMFLLGGWNNSENTKSPAPNQALSHNCERLALKRESIWRVGDSAAAHLSLALGCLEVADDVSLFHHMNFVVNHVRACAKLVNDLIATRNEGAA
jgi:hypothetical protein